MKIPISKRLRLCAQLVPEGARVADIGTDHGYLGLYLLQNGLAAHVLAADLRPQPLQTAKLHAAKFGFAGQMEFRLSDGLAEIAPDEADTIVCAGMGGDLIVEILSACPWLRDRNYTLILQPQSAGQELRRWLGEHGFAIACEQLVQDGKFLYTVLRAHPGAGTPLAGRAVRLAVAAPERLAAARRVHAAHRNCAPPQRGGPDGRGASAARAPGLLPVRRWKKSKK
ncbi:MAG: class I SAM-dependent methyltransferase [Oscillospiraceae bacterium]